MKQPIEKINNLYLEQIKNNETEKYGSLKQLTIEDKLPKVKGQVNILELGVGGGETMQALKDQLHDRKNLNIIGLDSALLFTEHFRKKTDSDAVVADASRLPFQECSLSAINASAILHEVSSYGVNDGKEGSVFGQNAIIQTLNEVKRCLAENGVFVYRDIACPNDRLIMKLVVYERKSWQTFLDLYLPILHEASKDVCPDITNDFKLNRGERKDEVTATAQMHREIQRHYITFRDFVRKKIFPKIGIEVAKERWEDKESGNKIHSIILSGQALKNYIRFKGLGNQDSSIKSLPVELQSDEYDDFTDSIIEEFIVNDNFNINDEWFRREGREVYTYLSVKELKEMANKKHTLADGTSGHLEVLNEKLLPRNYYQRYLKRVINNPEYEGKRVIDFINKKYGE
ncbi:MAG: class I SAM-dependent methyltransferase [Candidatus Delongbacteria bacterium]|nr:class I SAM-dependent methyltransferase [Candidatus Delongbacteria bacterium]